MADTIESVATEIGKLQRGDCTAEQLVAAAGRLRELETSDRVVVADELGNTDTEGALATASLEALEIWTQGRAWQPAARETLRAAGLL